MTSGSSAPLVGCVVLIAEDEPVVALDLQGLLIQLGSKKVHVAARVPDVHAVLDATRPDAAVIDTNLKGEVAFEVGERLDDLDVPFVVVTGRDADAIPKKWLHRVVMKPYHPDDLANLIVTLVTTRQTQRRVERSSASPSVIR